MKRSLFALCAGLSLSACAAGTERQTVGGAYARTLKETELARRGDDLAGDNGGTNQGRQNAVRLPARQAETPLDEPGRLDDWTR